MGAWRLQDGGTGSGENGSEQARLFALVEPIVHLARNFQIVALRNELDDSQWNTIRLSDDQILKSFVPIVKKGLAFVAVASPRQEDLQRTEETKVLDVQRRFDHVRAERSHGIVRES